MKKKTSSPSYEDFCSSIYYDGTTKIPNLIINHRKIHKENGCYDLSQVEDGIDVFFGYTFVLNKDEYDVLRGENEVEFEKLFQTAKILSEKEENIAAKLFYYSLLLYGPGDDKEEVIKSLENISKTNEENLDLTFGCASDFILDNYFYTNGAEDAYFRNGVIKFIKVLSIKYFSNTKLRIARLDVKGKSKEDALKLLSEYYSKRAQTVGDLNDITDSHLETEMEILGDDLSSSDISKIGISNEELLNTYLNVISNYEKFNDNHMSLINTSKVNFSYEPQIDLFSDELYGKTINYLISNEKIDGKCALDSTMEVAFTPYKNSFDEVKPSLETTYAGSLLGNLITDNHIDLQSTLDSYREHLNEDKDNLVDSCEFYKGMITSFNERKNHLSTKDSLILTRGIIRDVDEIGLGLDLLNESYKKNIITPNSYLQTINSSIVNNANSDDIGLAFSTTNKFLESVLNLGITSSEEIGSDIAAKNVVEIYNKSISKGLTNQKTVDAIIDGYEVKNEKDLEFKLEVYKNQFEAASDDKKKEYKDKISKAIEDFTTNDKGVNWKERYELTEKYLDDESAQKVLNEGKDNGGFLAEAWHDIKEILKLNEKVSLTAKDADGKNWYEKIINYKFGKREGGIIDIITDYGWSNNSFRTSSNNKNYSKENNIPFCYAIEYQQLYNASISNIIQSLVGAIVSSQHVVQNIQSAVSGVFKTTTKFLSTVIFSSEKGENGTSVEEEAANGADKIIDKWTDKANEIYGKVGSFISEMIARFTRTGQSPVATGSGLLAPYLLMYCVKPTNRKYCFPMLDKSSSYFKAVNKMDEKDGGMGSSILGNKLFSTMANAGRTLMGIAEDIEQIAPFLSGQSAADGGTRQYHIERSKYFSYPSDGEEIDTSFVLYNTVKQNIWKDHYKFIMGFMLRNLPFKYDVVAYYPPLFYDVHVPGVKRCPFCYVDNFDVSPIGLTRTLKISGKDFGIGEDKTLYSVNVPEAWLVKVKFKSLLATSSNQILSGFIDTPITSNVSGGSPENKTT